MHHVIMQKLYIQEDTSFDSKECDGSVISGDLNNKAECIDKS